MTARPWRGAGLAGLAGAAGFAVAAVVEFMAVAGLAMAASTTSVAAQPTRPPAFENSLGQRLLACTGCHGKEGRAAADGYYPRIAGKPAGYLFNQLRNFRDGRRHYELMTGLLAPLDDGYLREIAGHFAGLELSYAPPLAAAESAAVRAAGEGLVRRGDPSRGLPACTACHGAAMTGRGPFIPGLLGLPRDYLNAQLGAWRSGKRRAAEPDCMARIAARLAPEDIGAVSAWLASQPVPKAGAATGAASGAASVESTASAAADAAPLPIPCGGVAEPQR